MEITNNNQPDLSSPEIKSPASPMQPIRPSINWSNELRQYGAVLALALPLFAVFSVYLINRRGYYDLYIINKIFAGEGAVLLGLILLIGPLSRMFKVFDRYVQYRKELGIVAFFLIMAHVVSSYFFLPNKFPVARYWSDELWSFLFGLAASTILIFIFLISNSWASAKLGRRRWWRLQYWGLRLTFLLVVGHVFVMKYAGWVSWYQKGGSKELAHPDWPGAGLIVGWFMFFVVLVRLAEAIHVKLGKIIWYFSALAFPLVIIFTFWWGSRFAK